MNLRGSLACSITASLALILVACEKSANEESRNPVSPETGGNTQSFPTLPLLGQEKGGMAEATEDLKALHVAMQRYLKANDDIWPQAPDVKVDSIVPSEQFLKEHSEHEGNRVEPNADSLVKINIRKSGAYVVMGQQVTEEELTKWIKEEVEKKPDLKVLIRCDQEAKHLYLANVMSICRHVGVPHANIAMKTEQ